jgi:EmrB/QacA subfamily drug resistance transporter
MYAWGGPVRRILVERGEDVSTSSDTNEESQASLSAQRWVLILAAVGALMVMLDTMVVNTALNSIRIDLHAAIDELEWTVNAYTLSFAVLLMTASALGDRYGRRRLFVIGVLVFTLASAACALAPGVTSLIVARAVQGAGSAMIMPHALALLGAIIPPQRRAWALGIFSSVTGLATLGGPLVGGAITEGLDWQWIFWLNIPIGIVLVPFILTRIEESHGARSPIDVPGLLLVSGGAFGLVWGLIRGNAAGWGSGEVVLTLAGGAIFTIGFVLWEMRAAHPMLPLPFFRSAAFSSGNAVAFLLYGSIFGSAFFMAQFLQTTLHYGPFGAGLRLLPWTVTLFLVAPVAGSMVSKVGERPLIVGGLLLQTGGFGWIALIAGPDLDYKAMILPLVIAGGGVSLAMPSSQHAVISAVPRQAVGKASGTFNMLRQLGGTFGIAILAVVFSAYGGFDSAEAFSDGFGPAMVGAATLSLLAAIAGLGTPGRQKLHQPVGPTPSPEHVPAAPAR